MLKRAIASAHRINAISSKVSIDYKHKFNRSSQILQNSFVSTNHSPVSNKNSNKERVPLFSLTFFNQWAFLIQLNNPTRMILTAIPALWGIELGNAVKMQAISNLDLSMNLVLSLCNWMHLNYLQILVNSYVSYTSSIFSNWFAIQKSIFSDNFILKSLLHGDTGLTLLVLFGAWTIHCTGSIINHILGQILNSKINNSNEPCTSKLITINSALYMLGIHLIATFIVLITLPPACTSMILLFTPLIIINLLLKQHMHIYQVSMAMVLTWGIFVGFAATTGHVSLPVLIPMWIGSIAWTLIYDTINSYQYVKDKTNTKSIRFLFRNKNYFYLLTLINCFCYTIVGFAADMSFVYYVGLLLGIFSLTSSIQGTNFKNPYSCVAHTKSHIAFTLIILFSIHLNNIYSLYILD